MRPPIDLVAGRYRLISLLGKGGMGSVWRGEHASLATPVAIKLLDPRLAEKDSVRARFVREARAAASLRSKHVVQILDHGVEEGIPFIVMELLRGESLGARLQRERKIEPRAFSRIFAEMGRAVARAHQAGIIHRDLKPDNVFLSDPEEETAGEAGPSGNCVVKVVDFGIAKILDDDSFPGDVSTDTGTMIGTPHYMSPEQARGLRTIDSRTDLWSMAVIAYECLVGERPFRADALGELVLKICSDPPPVPSEVAPVPNGFDAWFAKATQRKVEARFQDVADLVRSLEDILTPGLHHFEIRSSATPAVITPAPSTDPELESTVHADAHGGFDSPSAAAPKADVATHDPTTSTLAPTSPRPRSRAVLLGLGVAALVGVGAIASMGGGARPGPESAGTSPKPGVASAASVGAAVIAGAGAPSATTSASAPPQATAMVLTIRTTPKGATILRGAEPIGSADEPISLAWTDETFEITVKKTGFKPQKLTIAPAANVERSVKLEPAPHYTETPF